MHPGRRDNEARRRLEEALMNRLYVKSTLETDQNKLRMLNSDLMMWWQGAPGGGWQVWGYSSKCSCDTCINTWKSVKCREGARRSVGNTLRHLNGVRQTHTRAHAAWDNSGCRYYRGVRFREHSPNLRQKKKTCKNTSVLWQQASLLWAPLFLILHVISCTSSSRRGMRISVRNIPAEEPEVTATKDGPPLCSK